MESFPEDLKQGVIDLMEHISIANGYNMDIAGITDKWDNDQNKLKELLPHIYVTNELDQSDVRRGLKFNLSCGLPSEIGIIIIGTVRAVTGIESLGNFIMHDIQKALLRDPTVGGLVDEIKEWTVFRPEPWGENTNTYKIRLHVKYSGSITF